MSYFPFFIDISDKLGLIVGGGKVACRKVIALSEFSARLRVVAIECCDELEEFAKDNETIELNIRPFNENDLEDIDFCIAATANHELNENIARLCRDRKILVNVVDVKELCGFIFPAYIKKNEVVIGISSGGKSPLIAQEVRKNIEATLPENIGDYADFLGDVRQTVKSSVEGEKNRKACYKELWEYYKTNGVEPDQNTVALVISKYQS